MANETIAAIATPLMQGALGVLRISGPDAVAAADRIFTAKSGKKLAALRGYTAAYGALHTAGSACESGAQRAEKELDDCVALVFRAPHSYTGEDCVEFDCHGGPYVMRAALGAALGAGARLAQPGEFTKRAFLAGKMDLTRAEAVMELITAKSGEAARAAEAQREGALFRRVQRIRARLLEISADICAYVDFPDEDIPSLSPQSLKKELREISQELAACAGTYDGSRMLRDGVAAAIAGRPNVGKSTLMNLLAGFDRSIVTEIPGTTRDVVEQRISFAGAPLVLCDTAGLRATDDPVESIGVTRAKNTVGRAELVFAVFDASRELTPEDKALLKMLDEERTVIILNKTDLPQKIDEEYIKNKYRQIVKMSAKTGEGIHELEKAVKKIINAGTADPSEGMIANLRQLECINEAGDGAQAALGALADGMTLDAVSTGVAQALGGIAKLTGENVSEETINRVFEKFCVGK